MTPINANDWLAWPKPNPNRRLRLFCIPYAGGGSQIFSKWPELLPSDIEVCAVNLPGRGRRIAEAPFTALAPLARTLTRNLLPFTDVPFAFFGHSMGALISYEVCRQMYETQGAVPAHLFVSGCFAPHIADPKPLHGLADSAFVDEVRKLGGMPEQVLASAELMELVLPTLRADFTVAETYQHSSERPLLCPITAFGGTEDCLATEQAITQWRQHTNSRFDLHMFPGDHFFLQPHQSHMLRLIATALQGDPALATK